MTRIRYNALNSTLIDHPYGDKEVISSTRIQQWRQNHCANRSSTDDVAEYHRAT